MDVKSYNLEDYKKFQLSKSSVTSQFTDLVEFCLISEDESAKHSFHMVYVHNWTSDPEVLFDTLSESMCTTLVPINVNYENDVVSFYTCNLNLIFRIIKSDFTFVCNNIAYHVDCIVFNSASSYDIFGRKYTLEEIIRNIVMLRFNSENNELDLSNFCAEREFSDMNIYFYKISLLAYYKELMLRMGREVEILNLSNNNLKEIPREIINFFIKGQLIGLNASNNDINLLKDVRSHSLIEKLWLEGNPLCEQYKDEPYLYVKQAIVKFPRLQWLDDIPVNRLGLIFPFWRSCLVTDDEFTISLVDKFLILFFSHYDGESRKHLQKFYRADCILTISTGFAADEEYKFPHYTCCSRNLLRAPRANISYRGASSVTNALANLPRTTHDPNSFTVDVLQSDSSNVTLIVDGVYKEQKANSKDECLIQFRRTFVLWPENECTETRAYYITNDMLSVTYPSKEIADSCFQTPVRNLNSLVLVNPGNHDIEAITAVFIHHTQLKKRYALERLRSQNWDLEKALVIFCSNLRLDHIPRSHFKVGPNDDENDDVDMKEENAGQLTDLQRAKLRLQQQKT